MDINLSKRLDILRFPLIVGVVFVHSYQSSGYIPSDWDVSQTVAASEPIQYYFSFVLGRLSVPVFYCLSGFLFYHGFVFSKDAFLLKLKTRIRSLLIPYLIWNIAVLLFIMLMQSIPFTAAFFSDKNHKIASYGCLDYINAIMGFTRYPAAYHFWYIRDLLVMIFLIPVLDVLIRKMPLISLMAMMAFWFFRIWPLYIPSADAICFFYLGTLIGAKDVDLTRLDSYWKHILLAYVVASLLDISTRAYAWHYQLHKIQFLLGCAAMFCITKHVLNLRLSHYLLSLSKVSFFIFALHEPLLTIVRKIAYRLFMPLTDIKSLLIYFTAPWLVVIICIMTYGILAKLAPSSLKVITGGR